MHTFDGDTEWRGYVPSEIVDTDAGVHEHDANVFAMLRVPAAPGGEVDEGFEVYEDSQVKELLEYIDGQMSLSGAAGFAVNGVRP
eukprot:SAG31_NODE_24670_length_476_cov_1.368700_1_plen_85_part_00